MLWSVGCGARLAPAANTDTEQIPKSSPRAGQGETGQNSCLLRIPVCWENLGSLKTRLLACVALINQ